MTMRRKMSECFLFLFPFSVVLLETNVDRHIDTNGMTFSKIITNNCQHHEKRRDFLWNWKKNVERNEKGKEYSLKCSSKHTAARRHNGASNDDDDEKDDDEWAEYVCMTESRLMTQPWHLISHGSRNQ